MRKVTRNAEEIEAELDRLTRARNELARELESLTDVQQRADREFQLDAWNRQIGRLWKDYAEVSGMGQWQVWKG